MRLPLITGDHVRWEEVDKENPGSDSVFGLVEGVPFVTHASTRSRSAEVGWGVGVGRVAFDL